MESERVRNFPTNMGSTNYCNDSFDCLYYETNNFFFRDAKLRIVETKEDRITESFHAPRGSTPVPPHIQQFLKVVIKNKGHRSALNCKAQLRVVFQKSADTHRYPTRKAYNLVWGDKSDKSDIAEKAEIPPDTEQELHLVVADSSYESHSERFTRRKYAQISTFSHLKDNSFMEADSFSDGEYVVKLVVS